MKRDRKLQPLISLALLVALLFSSCLPSASAAQPPIDPAQLNVGTTSISRLRADPKRAYDFASGRALMNVYDTLITTTAENHTSFMPSLAAAWGKDISGLMGGTSASPVWWFKLRFTNDTGDPILFQPWMDRDSVMHTNDALTMDDVIWSFYYGLVQDLSGSPMWMLWHPLFNTPAASYGSSPLTSLDPAEVHGVVIELTDRIWHNGTHIFFKLAFDFPDVAWQQILAQTWGSIVSKDWAVDRGCWDGTWFKTEVGESVGTGDGVKTRFTLPPQDMPLGGPDAYKKVVPGSETILLNGVPTTAYTMIYNNGTIDFTTAPIVGVPITASYEHAYFYYFRRWPNLQWGPMDSKLSDYPQATWDQYRMCGTGPYIFTEIDMVLEYFRHDRFDNYWAGWALTAAQPAHVNTIITSWVDGDTAQWSTRLSKFLAGDYDIIAVPRDSMFDLFKPGWDINNPDTWIPVDGVYSVKNIAPVVALDAIHFNFNINPLSTLAGTQEFPDGIPLDFFSNVHVRRAFAYMFNYTRLIQDAYYGEAEQPTTWAIQGLSPDYTLTNLTKMSKDLDKAKAELQLAMFTQGETTQSAWDWGFHMTITYNLGNKLRETICYIIRDALAELSNMHGVANHFSADVAVIDPWWPVDESLKPLWSIGWLQDYSDPHNFARPYMHSEGDFAIVGGGYNNTYVDQLLDWGLHNSTYMPNGTPNPMRRLCYEKLQMIYMEELPSIPIAQPYTRHFQRTWVRGWHYNALMPGCPYYHMWKQDGGIDTVEDMVNVVCDLNWDNIVDMKDIGMSVKAFGSTPGTPKWNFHADVAHSVGDRKVDMKDVGYVVGKFSWAA